VKINMKNEEGTPANGDASSSHPTPADLPPLRRVTVADVHKVEGLVRARLTRLRVSPHEDSSSGRG
jgi:hypothetical protein